MSYDSTEDTNRHILRVIKLVNELTSIFVTQAYNHDTSKLVDPELSTFNEYTPKLKTTTYGSVEYKKSLSAMDEALKHHYANNRHHPEHFANGIAGMTLIDLAEMLADWKAATERHDNGDINRSITINTQRFGISSQLSQVLTNTVEYMGWARRSDD